MSLLTHENSSIGKQTLEILEELLDPDNECGLEAMTNLANTLIKEGLTSQIKGFLSICENESKSNNNSDGDGDDNNSYDGFSNVLNLILNITKIDGSVGLNILKKIKFMTWITDRILPNDDEDDTTNNNNKSVNETYLPNFVKYQIAEFLAEIFITEPTTVTILSKRGVEMLLVEISKIRDFKQGEEDKNKNNKNEIEMEDYFRDIFDILISSVRFAWVNQSFLENEGIQLMLMLLNYFNDINVKKKKIENFSWIKLNILKVLSESSSGFRGTGKLSCISIIDNGGLKILFSLLRKVRNKIKKKFFFLFSSFLLTN